MKTITWSIVAFAAAAITAAIFIYSVFAPTQKQETARFLRANGIFPAIFWIYVGAFSAIAITLGLIDAMMNGYGDGDIF